MRIKIDIEIPNWSKWLVAGIAIGILLGRGRRCRCGGGERAPHLRRG
jgi:hypothetical protein